MSVSPECVCGGHSALRWRREAGQPLGSGQGQMGHEDGGRCGRITCGQRETRARCLPCEERQDEAGTLSQAAAWAAGTGDRGSGRPLCGMCYGGRQADADAVMRWPRPGGGRRDAQSEGVSPCGGRREEGAAGREP